MQHSTTLGYSNTYESLGTLYVINKNKTKGAACLTHFGVSVRLFRNMTPCMSMHLSVHSTSGHPFLVRQQNHHAGGYMQFLLIRARLRA